tara:strand:- start:8887 stop:11268 length:2382 start_codon:yes stop_codon:yes gene_type:complete
MKDNGSKIDFIKWFSELDKNSVSIAGGKGANLAEIYNLKIGVPSGFVVTTKAYDYLIENANLKEKINKLLESIDFDDVKKLNEATTEIRKLIVNAEIPKDLEEEIIESYEALSSKDLDNQTAHDLLKEKSDGVFVAVRSSATAEDLEDASFAGQQESFLNVKGDSDLLEHIKKTFASLFTSRATYYRNKKGFGQDVKLAVIVQKMVNSEKSGVIFSKDPSYKNENVMIEAVFGLGEGIVSGRITPDRYIVSSDLKILEKKISNKKIALIRTPDRKKNEIKLTEEKSKSQALKETEVKKLAEIALKLEKHYKKPQDIEFAIEGDEIYIVQTRAITTIGKRTDLANVKELKGEIVLEGLAASPGIGFGKTKIVKSLEDLEKITTGDVLVTKMTNPDMVVAMHKASAIITDEGGITSHAAIVSRELGIPSVVGTREATIKIREDEIVTVDGFAGKIYKGKVSETVQKEVLPINAETKTKIKVIVDLPSAAERASKAKSKDVGLLRLEGIIAESGKHPNYFLEKDNLKEYEEIIFKGVDGISKYFDNLWVRTSDIRSDEFKNLDGAPKKLEKNPMLGMHGMRYSLKHPGILKAELKALKRISEKGKKIGLLLPQIISVDEVKKVKEFLKETNFHDAKVGVMIETPSSVQIIKELCEEGIDFISFGTNDLTQYTLAIDRGNETVQGIYNEMHPAILKQIEYVLRVAGENNVERSICGQAGSKKEMVKFLVEKGIDSISVNPDAAKEISDYVQDLESNESEDKTQSEMSQGNLIPIEELLENEEIQTEEERKKEVGNIF